MKNDFMFLALKEAEKAYKKGEIPIGAVIVKGEKVIAKAHNTREKSQNALNHAETLAIFKACKKLKSWRLSDCDMYVTLEPCVMCAGAILNARIKNLYFACSDKDHGAVISKYQILQDGTLNHKTNVCCGEMETEAKNLIQKFFKNIRKNKG